jgi:SAM-dependent methyltransferase
MSIEDIRHIDAETLELFASKGKECGGCVQLRGIGNGVKVRRVMQITRDLATRPGEELRILDLACGEGVYAIEAALRGAQVLALDARTERMSKGARAAERLGLTNVSFEQEDVRNVTVASHGEFDVIYLLGILYHLDVPDAFHVLENVQAMCRSLIIVDTHVSLHPQEEVDYKGQKYRGAKCREHGDADQASVRRSRVLASLDNTFSFQFTKPSLIRLLNNIGFTSVFDCHAPLEPYKPDDRITFAALKGTRVMISAYPWVNGKTEEEIEETLGNLGPTGVSAPHERQSPMKRSLRTTINVLLRPFGYELRRI